MDVSNHEQVVICVRWVSADLDVHEDFVELSQVNKTDAGTSVTRNIFEDEYISLHKLIGQCYDSAENNYGWLKVWRSKTNPRYGTNSSVHALIAVDILSVFILG